MGKPKTREAVMAQRVLELYLNTMKNNREFQEKPSLDLCWFKKHFATVAHEHGIFHGGRHGGSHEENLEAQERYNMYFWLVRSRVSMAIKRLAVKKQQQAQAAQEQQQARPPVPRQAPKERAQAARVRLTLPQQLGLPGIPASKR